MTAPANQAGSNITGDATREAADTADETPSSTGTVDQDRLCDTLPGSGEVLEARVDTVLVMYEHLRKHGTTEKPDLLKFVDVDAVSHASPDSVWANMVKGKDTLRASLGVETPSTRRTEWRHTGGTNA